MSHASERFIQLSHLHKLRRCEQVAAVCYRLGGRGIEFLLVQTRGGRWTFPKGSTEPGLSHAQAAALEAFEEAGVHGRIEEAPFARYRHSTGYIHAHLCEVLRLDPPQEFGRDPAWFSAGKAKRRLRQGRKGDCAAEISAVVDRAVARIEGQRSAAPRGGQLEGTTKDALQKVQFEADAGVGMETAFVRYVRREVTQFEPGANEDGRPGLRAAKVLQLSVSREPDGNLPVKRRLP
jgi:8-oxo-dGTP pyrophosphatase MutT (NUDIX family)